MKCENSNKKLMVIKSGKIHLKAGGKLQLKANPIFETPTHQIQ